MPETTFKIYGLFDPRTDELRYVGRTSKELSERLNRHKSSSKRDAYHNARWIKSLLKLNLEPVIRLLHYSINEIENKFDEIFWIAFFKKLGFKLTNTSDGGEGNSGYKHSEETKLKLAEISRGHRLTQEQKEKVSLFHKGRKRTRETINRMIAASPNRVFSEETKNRISNQLRENRSKFKDELEAGRKKSSQICRILSDSQILEIDSLLNSGESMLSLSKKFDVSYGLIRSVKNRETDVVRNLLGNISVLPKQKNTWYISEEKIFGIIDSLNKKVPFQTTAKIFDVSYKVVFNIRHGIKKYTKYSHLLRI